MPIDGNTELIAHLGYPTHSFKAPLIYNPYFESVGVNVAVVTMGCRAAVFPEVFRGFFALENARGALVTMPHKISVLALLDEVSVTAEVAGACNAVRRKAKGKLVGDMFDGEGFVRAVRRNGFDPRGASAQALLAAARERGCRVQGGTDVLFEMIPAYLEFFGLPTATPEVLRAVARLQDPQGSP